jgi:hypothetical protein
MATVSNINGQLRIVYPNKTEYYQFHKLSNLSWVLNNDGFYYVLFTYEDDYFFKIQISDITNQPAWTNTQPGAEQAVNDISSWIGLSITTSLLATESTLLQVLSAVDNMRDYEVRLVQDSATPDAVTWLEVRYWDAQSGTLGAPQYYLPGSSIPGSPVLPITYVNNQNVLLQILSELQAINLDTNGLSQEATQLLVLAAINTIISNTTGLAQEVTLNALLTAFNAEDFATETTLQVVETNTTGVARTPGLIRPTNVSGNVNTVAANFYSVSVANVGASNGAVLSAVIKPGEILNFSADALNNFFTSFAYDATGTEFIITYVS